MKNIAKKQEELVYPHELLILSSKRAMEVLEGKYNKRTKILAFLFLFIQGRKTNLRIKTDDPYLKILLTMAKRSRINIRRIAKEVDEKLLYYIHQFEETQSTTAFADFEDYLKDCIYLHVISKEIMGIPILSSLTIKSSMKYVKPKSELRDFLVAIQLLERREEISRSADMNRIISTLSLAKETPLIEASLMLSFLLAVKFPELKSELLLTHYTTLKIIADEFEKLLEHKKLDDIALQQLFMKSIVLSLCGYSKSLRLSHEEGINYLEEIIKLPFIECRVSEIFDRASKLRISQFELPLWCLLIVAIVLVFIHVFAEIHLTGSVNIGIVSFSIPAIPFFLTVSIILSIMILYKLLRLKKELLSKLRRG